MTLANILTFTRLLIALASFVAMYFDAWILASIGILVAVLLDILDGIIARKLDQVTTGGIYFDVLADKIVIISTYLVLGLKVHLAFFVLGILMLIREYTIDTMRSIAASKQIVISADKWSKIKGILFMTAMIVASFNQVAQLSYVTLGAIILGALGMIFAYATLVRFFVKYVRDIL